MCEGNLEANKYVALIEMVTDDCNAMTVYNKGVIVMQAGFLSLDTF